MRDPLARAGHVRFTTNCEHGALVVVELAQDDYDQLVADGGQIDVQCDCDDEPEDEPSPDTH